MKMLSRRRAVQLTIASGVGATGLVAATPAAADEFTEEALLEALQNDDPDAAMAVAEAVDAFKQSDYEEGGRYFLSPAATKDSSDTLQQICHYYKKFVLPVLNAVINVRIIPKKWKTILIVFKSLMDAVCE